MTITITVDQSEQAAFLKHLAKFKPAMDVKFKSLEGHEVCKVTNPAWDNFDPKKAAKELMTDGN